MKELVVPATKEGMSDIMQSLEQEMVERKCPIKKQRQLIIALEELLVNILYYAYPSGEGIIKFAYEFHENGAGFRLAAVCSDWGTGYNPLKQKEPDVTLPAEKRTAGGLGIFLARRLLDTIRYERKGGENRLFIEKQL